MKLTDFRTFTVHDGYRNFVIVRLSTDKGIHGYGEGTVEWHERAAEAAVAQLAARVMGADPFDSEHVLAALARNGYWPNSIVIASAISAIDQALWDIKGKATGRPVVELLGGAAGRRLRAYANAWYWGATSPREFAERAVAIVDRGFTAMKWDPFGDSLMTLSATDLRAALDNVTAVRAAVGPDIDLLIECHGRFTPETAIRVAEELAPMRPLFMEEPVVPEAEDQIARVAARSPVMLATGERLCSLNSFASLIERRAIGVIQPDASHALGISGLRKIAALAEAHGVLFAPHNASGPLGTASALHVAAAVPNSLIFEYFVAQPEWLPKVFRGAPKVVDGFVEVPDRPGLGIDIDEDAAAAHPFREYWGGENLFSSDWHVSLPEARR